MTMTRRVLLQQIGATACLLSQAGSATAAGAVAGATARRLKIVVAGGHPGDPEYGCGGTIARLTQQGHAVVLLYLNDGAWPPTPASVRLAEAKRACSVLGATSAYAGQQNSAAVVSKETYDRYFEQITAERPDAVFTHWPIDNHRDHRATANLCYDAWQRSGRKFALYYYEVSVGEDTLQFAPNRFVDITATQARKHEACFAHASQTPERYYALQDQTAAFRGAESGYKRAEAFVWQQQSPFDLLAPNRDGAPGLV